jgi:glycosyltransferase involved in cell wall biosynthesis
MHVTEPTSQVPLVSAIIATYNRAPLLVQAVQSVLAQSFTDYELIVADDGSTDDTAERVAALDAPIRYLRLEHSGRPSVTFNRALAVAEGRLIAFLADDDLWDERKLARQVAVLEHTTEAGFVYSDFRFLTEDGISAPVMRPEHKQSGRMLEALLDDCVISACTVLVRREALDQAGWFNESFSTAEDYDLWVRLAQITQAAYIDEPLALIRKHEHQLSQERQLASWQNVIRTLESTWQRGGLTVGQRWRLRRNLGRRYTHLGLMLLADNRRSEALSAFKRAVRINPLQRRGWQALLENLGVS